MLFFFFFSSRRRHTRLQGDWSSDVCGELYEAEEVDGSSVVAGCEATEVLELVEASLDSVAVFVDGGVVRDGRLARAVGRNHRLGSGFGDDRPQGIAVIGFVGEDGIG